MSDKIKLLVPKETINIIRNPSGELNLEDWAAIGSGISRSPDEARFGWNSVRVFTNDLDPNEGVYVRSFPNTLDTIYAGSVYVKGQGRVRLRMRDGTNGLDFPGEFVNLETDPELDVPACDPNFLLFDGDTSEINCGQDARIQDLQDDAFTVEAWIRADSAGEGVLGRIADKLEWQFRVQSNDRIAARIDAAVQNAESVSQVNEMPLDGLWHHVAMTFDDAGTRLIRIWVDGIEITYPTQDDAQGAIVTDAGRDLIIGNRSAGTSGFDGGIGWLRISDNLRYTDNFIPPGRCALPEIDDHTIAQWIGVEQDGEGSLVENQEGDANLDGTEANTAIGCACTDPARGKKWRRLSVVGKVGVAQNPVPFPNLLEFNGVDSRINCGQDARIQDLQDDAFTVEAWIRADSAGEGVLGRIADKLEWQFRVQSNDRIAARIDAAVQNAESVSQVNEMPLDGLWHHVAMTFDDAGTRLIRIWVDGIEITYPTQDDAQGAIVTDAGRDLIIGNRSNLANTFDGGIGWLRISDFLRYTANFTPPDRCILPAIDANIIGQWIGTETNPAVVDNQEGDANLDGVGTNVVIDADCQDIEEPSNDLRLIVETDQEQEAVFYVDGAQIEEGELTTYCDGDQPGCRWNGTFHDSTSQRNNPEFREGGVITTIPMIDPDLYVTISSGLGMPPIRQIFQELAILPGSVFERSKALSRTIDLTFWARNLLDKQPCFPASIDRLNEIRQALIDVIKPDLVKDQQPFVLFYEAEQGTVFTSVRYDSGLEFTGDLRNPYFNSFNMRTIAESPFWNEDDQTVRTLELSDAVDADNRIIARIEGEWQQLGTGAADGAIFGLGVAPNGDIYATGAFANIGGIAANRIARWDGENWSSLGVGLGVTQGEAIAAHPDGRIFVVGNFTTAGGAAANRVAEWDPVAETWSALGSGVNGNARDIVIGHDGSVYVCGAFTTAGGNPAQGVARWDGGTWHSLAGSVDGNCNAIAVHPDGSIYVGGLFLNAGGASAIRIARFVLDTGTWSTLGAGLDAAPDDIAIASDGTVYAYGDFDFAGTTAVKNIAQWNGTDWFALGDGVDGVRFREIAISPDGKIWVGGELTEIDGVDVGRIPIAFWNGSIWTLPDLLFPNGVLRTIGEAFLFVGKDFYIGIDDSVDIDVSSVQDIVNPGTASIFPRFKFTGPGKLVWLENLTTDDVIYFDYDAIDEEEVVIDMREQIKTIVSNFRGNVISAVRPNSDFATFQLLPGTNRIKVFISDEVPETQFQISLGTRHWSFDGVAA